jgi:hypothetical protein
MDLHFETEKMSEELMKFHIKGLPFDAVIHRFTGKDVGEPHDHPFGFRTYILSGGYTERRYNIPSKGHWTFRDFKRTTGDTFYMPADGIHQIIELQGTECYTIILPYDWERECGFWQFIQGEVPKFRKWHESEFKSIDNEAFHDLLPGDKSSTLPL